MVTRFTIATPVAFSTATEVRTRRLWLVWLGVLIISFTIVLLIVGAPVARANSHEILAANIYQAFSLVCHQLPERSLRLDGYQFAVCSRCTGLYVGFALATLVYPLARSLSRTDTPARIWLVLAAVPLLVDFSLGYFSIWENTHLSRFITGALLSSVAVFYIIPGLLEVSRATAERMRAKRRD